MGPRKPGRPPAGVRPGERVVDYPQLTVRVPTATVDMLQALCTVTGEPQWRVLSEAVDHYIRELPPYRRQLLVALLRRSGSGTQDERGSGIRSW